MGDILNKKYKGRIKNVEQVNPLKFWPTGILGIDYILNGGLPQRRTVEVWGGESVGKTTLLLESSKEFLENGYKVFFIDGEGTFSKDDVSRLDIPANSDNFHVGEPESGEEGIEMILDAIEEGYALIILDSVPSLIPKAKQKKMQDDPSASAFASEAVMWKDNINTISSRLKYSEVIKADGTLEKANGTSLVMINQQRANVGSPYGGKTTMGGYSLLHHYSARVRLQAIRKAADEDTGGRRVLYSLDKSKVGLPNRSTEMSVLPSGIDRFDNLITFGVWTEDIIRKGAWYYLSSECAEALERKEKLGQGAKAIYEAFSSDSNLYLSLYQRVYQKAMRG